MPENTNKVIQLKDSEGNDVSPVVNVGSIYDKNGQKVDNLLSYVVAGTDVPIPELGDVTEDLQAQVDEKLAEVDAALAGIDTAVDDKLNESLGDISTPAQSLGLPSNASIGDLFNTLASVGDLHVWRRTTSSGVDYPVSTNRNAYQAGTTIEYLGNLGDKSRIRAGSYVGSGTNTVKIPSEKNVKAVIVDGYHERDSFSFIYVSYPTTKSIGIRFENNNAVNSEITISWGNQITIKDNMDGYYLNNSGKQYFYKLIL